MKAIGFIGLGTMGGPMANNLLKKGYPLTVYNRTAAKMEPLVAAGAKAASRPADAAAGADVVFTNVSDDAALLEVVLGKDGVIENVRPGMTVIDCSTVSPGTSKKLAQELAAKGAHFLDAPVTGGNIGAINGTLVFMIGGDPAVMDSHMDLFDTLGTMAIHMGPNGAGSSTKLAHNAIVGINSAAFAEGMAFAAKAGVDVEKFLQIVLAGGAGSKQAELKGRKIIEGDFSVQFSLQLMLKDLLLAAAETNRFQMPTPLLNMATSLYQMGLSKGFGDEDLSSVVRCYEEWIQLRIADIAKATKEADGKSD